MIERLRNLHPDFRLARVGQTRLYVVYLGDRMVSPRMGLHKLTEWCSAYMAGWLDCRTEGVEWSKRFVTRTTK